MKKRYNKKDMVKSISERLENPSTLDVIECGLVDSWGQSFPKTREGHKTFAHKSYVKVPGLAEVELLDNTLSITHRIDTTKTDLRSFAGLWALYERPPFLTEPFDGYRISDLAVGKFELLNGDHEVENPLTAHASRVAVNLALDYLCDRLNSKIEEQLRITI